MAVFWLFLVFFVLLLISATPLLGSFNIKGSLEFMLILFGIFFVGGWILFLCFPLFS
ncbi:hypothetical protein JJD41_19645 [Oxynema sp. CENA135]|uniref:Uncharacterized protein n=1 Tax=Oxynema aestuarii AP17 TaxID=2064643 RepID=A0A6H1TVF2_9CYAN|nr:MULTISPECIES: hypothetical protein [Oxynema]MBK4732067.1 hypothetical protein [Oxynema sp. CENA135]QIZ69299.1 hypothetical protein HCG48_00765 [Oxynema aestuarii AP17]